MYYCCSNANPVQSATAVREVAGFEGFMSALEAPKDASVVKSNHATRAAKPVQLKYTSCNVFAILDEDDEERVPEAVLASPGFMPPATFIFAKPQSSPCSSTRLAGAEIDPDL